MNRSRMEGGGDHFGGGRGMLCNITALPRRHPPSKAAGRGRGPSLEFGSLRPHHHRLWPGDRARSTLSAIIVKLVLPACCHPWSSSGPRCVQAHDRNWAVVPCGRLRGDPAHWLTSATGYTRPKRMGCHGCTRRKLAGWGHRLSLAPRPVGQSGYRIYRS